jgi:hypothetical protein
MSFWSTRQKDAETTKVVPVFLFRNSIGSDLQSNQGTFDIRTIRNSRYISIDMTPILKVDIHAKHVGRILDEMKDSNVL